MDVHTIDHAGDGEATKARVTQHACERGRQRLNLRPKAMVRLASHAFNRGHSPGDYAGRFRSFLEAQQRRTACAIRVHGEHLYIFSGDEAPVLITVTVIPSRYRRSRRRLRNT